MNTPTSFRQSEDSALAGLQHLKKSSHLLLATAPSISAYLSSRRNDLSSIQKVPAKNQQQDKTCHACGSIMIPGWSCRKSRQHVKQMPRKKHVKKQQTDCVTKSSLNTDSVKPDHVFYECDLCHSTTRFEMAKKTSKLSDVATTIKPASMLAGPKTSTQSTPSDPASINVASKTDTEGSGRKRAKKTKSGGLAALLAKSKSESASPAGFDLMDFMKSV